MRMRKLDIMRIYPAIDIKGGKCVRLLQGRAADETVYGDDPAAMAAAFESAGARFIHVVDLDGAFSGDAKNLDAVRRIVQAVSIPIQLGGGVRSMEAVEERLEMGVNRVILGTAALTDAAFAEEAAKRYPKRIVAGIDASNGFVAVKGWTEISGETALSLAKKLRALGLDTVIYTDIARDGTLSGPNLPATREMADSGMKIIASGGVGKLDDLFALEKLGVSGAIVGKAIYDGRVDLREALAAFSD